MVVRASWALAAVAALVFAFTVAWPSARPLTDGFAAYYTASRLLLQGQLDARAYDEAFMRPQVRQLMGGEADDILNANPPTTALMFLPLAPLAPHPARLAWTVLNVVFLVAGLAALVAAHGPLASWPRTSALGALLAVAFLFRPVHASFEHGQAYVLVFLLLALVQLGLSRSRSPLTGAALAAALLLKTAGTAVPLALLAARRWRALAWMAAIGLGVVALALPLISLDTWLAYRRLLAEVVAAPWLSITVYQTTRSLIWHLFTLDPRWNPHPLVELPALAPWLLGAIGVSTLAVTLQRTRQNPAAGVAAVVAWGW